MITLTPFWYIILWLLNFKTLSSKCKEGSSLSISLYYFGILLLLLLPYFPPSSPPPCSSTSSSTTPPWSYLHLFHCPPPVNPFSFSIFSPTSSFLLLYISPLSPPDPPLPPCQMPTFCLFLLHHIFLPFFLISHPLSPPPSYGLILSLHHLHKKNPSNSLHI